MPDPMTDAELAAIRERLSKATSGEWFWIPRWAAATVSYLRLVNRAPDGGEDHTILEAESHGSEPVTIVVDVEDATFIAASKTDVARLLDEVDRLRGELLRSRRILAHVPGNIAIAAKEAAGYANHIKTAVRSQ